MNINDKAVLWDMDGVLVDTSPFHFEAWRETIEGMGKDYSWTDFERGLGRRNDEILQNLLGNLPPEELSNLGQAKEVLFRSKIGKEGVRALPGVMQLLSNFQAERFRIALATSAPPENVQFILSNLGIHDYFDSIVSASDVTKGKPDPQVFLLAAKALDVNPSRCIVIEDAVAGVEAAKAAGMKCIALTSSQSHQALAKADLVTDNLGDLTNKEIYHLLAGI